MNVTGHTRNVALAHPEPWLPASMRWQLHLWLLVGFLILALLDKFAQEFRNDKLPYIVGLWVLLDLPVRRHWSSRAVLNRFGVLIALLAGGLLVGEAWRLLAQRPDIEMARAWREVWRKDGWLAWGMVCWLYAPIIVPSRWLPNVWHARWLNSPVMESGWVRWHLRLAFLFYAACLWASMASKRPDRSFGLFEIEIGLFIPLYLIVFSQSLEFPILRRRLLCWGTRVLGAVMLLSCALGVMYAVAPVPVQRWIEQQGIEDSRLVRREEVAPDQYEWRLQFPLGHHNRLAYISMLTVVVLVATAKFARQRKWKLWAWIGALAGLANLLFSMNRTALVALVAGLFMFFLLTQGRKVLWLLLLLPVGYLLLPAPQRERVNSIFKVGTYTQPNSTVVLRFIHWKAAGLMIQEDPVFGIGYSWRHFERYYEQVLKYRLDKDTDEQVHAHNLWLQIGAELGLPFLGVFMCWLVLRWLIMLMSTRHSRRWPRRVVIGLACWIALELMIQLFCLVNLPTRRSLGLLTFGLWAMMLVEFARRLPLRRNTLKQR